MKKIIIFVISLLVAIPMAKAEVGFYFSDGLEGITEIKTRTWNKFDVYLVYNNADFDVNFLLTELSYDKDKIELVKIEGLNNFIATTNNGIAFKRTKIPQNDNKKVAKLTFKSKKNGTSTIKLDDISVANFIQEISVKGSSIEVTTKPNVARISLIIGIISVIVLVVYIFYPKVLKKLKNKKK